MRGHVGEDQSRLLKDFLYEQRERSTIRNTPSWRASHSEEIRIKAFRYARETFGKGKETEGTKKAVKPIHNRLFTAFAFQGIIRT